MSDNYSDIVSDVFCNVIEELAFMFGDPAEAEDMMPADDAFWQAEMDFSGDNDGCILLLIPREMGHELAANFLGVDEEDEKAEKLAADAMKELLNVTCGQILTAVAGEKALFKLSVPEVSQHDLEYFDKMKNDPHTVKVLVDDYPCMIKFNIQ